MAEMGLGDGKLKYAIKRASNKIKANKKQRQIKRYMNKKEENKTQKVSSTPEETDMPGTTNRVKKEKTPRLKVEKEKRTLKQAIKDSKYKREQFRQGRGDYSNPVRAKVSRAMGRVGDFVKDKIEDIKDMGEMRRGMKDASGPTSRNKSLGVCEKGKKCTQQ
jgi:hypothetical protein